MLEKCDTSFVTALTPHLAEEPCAEKAFLGGGCACPHGPSPGHTCLWFARGTAETFRTALLELQGCDGAVIFLNVSVTSPKSQGLLTYVSSFFLTFFRHKDECHPRSSGFPSHPPPATGDGHLGEEEPAEDGLDPWQLPSSLCFACYSTLSREQSEVRGREGLLCRVASGPRQRHAETRAAETTGEAGREGTARNLGCLPAPERPGRPLAEIARVILPFL